MGLYLNPGNDLFARAVNYEIYVDKSRHYYEALSGYSGKVSIVGISYSHTTKEHKCVIECIRDINKNYDFILLNLD